MTPPKSLKALVSVSLLFAAFAIPSLATDTPNKVNPEIVRISYLEGDVRLSPENHDHPDLNSKWLTAAPGLVISQGDTLATGKGRAEIEFENGSTVYLADNSVLEFEELKTFDLLLPRLARPSSHVPQTLRTLTRSEIFLLTGTLTLDFRPAPFETLNMASPSGAVERYSKRFYGRFDSYLDGREITPLDPGGALDKNNGGPPIPITEGQTAAFFDDGSYSLSNSSYSQAPFDWNSWVANRVATRDAELQAAMKAANLKTSVPGLIDLYEAGSFFACGEYTCWQPKDASTPPDAAQTDQLAPEPARNDTAIFSLVAYDPAVHGPSSIDVGQSASAQSQSQSQSAPGTPRKRYVRYEPAYDCTQNRVVYEIDPVTHQEVIIDSAPVSAPWTSAACYGGDYIYFHRQFAFVPGHKHHHPPIHCVKVNGKLGYVLHNPADVKGKPPINLKYGVFAGDPRQGFHFTALNSTGHVKVLSSTPKELALNPVRGLTLAADPKITAHSLYVAEISSRVDAAKVSDTPLTYNFANHHFEALGVNVPGKIGEPIVVGKVDSYGGFWSVRNPLVSSTLRTSGLETAHAGIALAGFHGGEIGRTFHAGNFSAGGAHGSSSVSGGFHGGAGTSGGGGYHGAGGGGGGGGSFSGGGGSHGGGGGFAGGGGGGHAGGGGGASGGGGGHGH